MTGIAPLVLLWLWSQRDNTQRPSLFPQPAMPAWPTAASPPPPVSVFQPQPPPPTADTGTPLADLHQAPPKVVPAQKIAPAPKPKSKPKPTPAAALKKKATSAALSTSKSTAASKNASVLELQKILNARGAKLKTDGLYGPKTASAWQTLAKQKGLPPTISRVGPKIAKVVTQTYDALKVPAIP